MNKEKVKKNRKRYNLHYRIRKQGFRLKTNEKTICVPFDNIDLSKQTQVLRDEFGYAIQTEIR